ncbi:MAG: large subunit ribosomal protein L4 [Rhodothermales bacterium]|jgi:large subunit ribosomal protein L4
MATLPVINSAGDTVSQTTLADSWLEFERGDQAVKDTVVAFLASQHTGNHKTKTRREVSGGGAKPWRQKGTGRARAGSRVSPIWRGGGITFGPVPRSYDKKVNKKVVKLAMRRVLAERIAEDAVIIIDGISLEEPKTKLMLGFLQGIGAGDDVLVLLENDDNINVFLGSGNLPGVDALPVALANVYQLLLYKKIVITTGALAKLGARIDGGAVRDEVAESAPEAAAEPEVVESAPEPEVEAEAPAEVEAEAPAEEVAEAPAEEVAEAPAEEEAEDKEDA